MTEQLQNLAEWAKDALILQTPESVLRKINKNPDHFTVPSNDELWKEICELLGIDEDDSEALRDRQILYQPDFGLNKVGYQPTVQKIIGAIFSARQQIAEMLRSKGAQCLVLEQTQHATFLSEQKYLDTSSGWAKVEGEEGVVCKITPLNGRRLDSDAFCFDDGPLTHPHIVPEHHVFVVNDPLTYTVSFAPDYSKAENLYKLNYQGWQHDLSKLLSVLRDAMRGHAYAHSKGRVNADNSLSNILALPLPDNGQFRGLGADTLSMVKNGARFDTQGVSSTSAYSEQSLYDYDPNIETYSGATDVYSLGCMMLELLVRRSFWKDLEVFYKKTRSLNNDEREKAFFTFIETKIKTDATIPQDTEAAFTALIQSMVQANRAARPTIDTIMPQFEGLIRAVQAEEEKDALALREVSGDSAEDASTQAA